MGIPLWKSLFFFFCLGITGAYLFPTERELGKAYLFAGAYEQARGFLISQFQREPEDLANALRVVEYWTARGEYAQAARLGETLTRKHPEDARLHEVMARVYEWDLRPERAVPHWEALTRLQPELQEYWEKLMGFYLLRDRPEALIALYERMLERPRYDWAPYLAHQMADLLLMRGKPAAAEAVYEKIISRHPGSEETWRRLAQLYESTGQIEKSLELYRRWASARADRRAAMLWIEKLLRYAKGQEAVEALRRYAADWGFDPEFLAALSDLRERLGSVGGDTMLDFLLRAHQRQPENPRILRALAEIYAERKEYEKALEHLENYHAQDAGGGDVRSYHLLGDLRSALGDADGSRRAYEKALELLRTDER